MAGTIWSLKWSDLSTFRKERQLLVACCQEISKFGLKGIIRISQASEGQKLVQSLDSLFFQLMLFHLIF